MHAPLISIGMPAFNSESTLATAIRSILNQTYENWHLLLIDDGSTDGTVNIARRFTDSRISVYADRSHKGLVYRLNQAVAMSQGEYFARMDADDLAYPERLESQVGYLRRHPEVHLLGCGMLVFKGNGRAIGFRPTVETHQEICRRPSNGFPMGHPTWMGRTEWFRTHPYDPKAIRTEDQVLLLNAYLGSCFACLPEILCGYREDKLVLRKILRGRYEFTAATTHQFLARKRYLKVVEILLRQCAKAGLDTLAVATGLNYFALPHRARSLSAADRERWSVVWSELQSETLTKAPADVLVNV